MGDFTVLQRNISDMEHVKTAPDYTDVCVEMPTELGKSERIDSRRDQRTPPPHADVGAQVLGITALRMARRYTSSSFFPLPHLRHS